MGLDISASVDHLLIVLRCKTFAKISPRISIRLRTRLVERKWLHVHANALA